MAITRRDFLVGCPVAVLWSISGCGQMGTLEEVLSVAGAEFETAVHEGTSAPVLSKWRKTHLTFPQGRRLKTGDLVFMIEVNGEKIIRPVSEVLLKRSDRWKVEVHHYDPPRNPRHNDPLLRP